MIDDDGQFDDPLDTLLRDAFASEMADIAGIDISRQVMARLRRRLRVRALTLGLSVVVGLCVAGALALPGLTELLGWLGSSEPLSPALTAVLPVVVLAALAPWLLSMVDDRV